jgi:hypothetical protein
MMASLIMRVSGAMAALEKTAGSRVSFGMGRKILLEGGPARKTSRNAPRADAGMVRL